ncbi:sulfurtransferase TusA family protein [Jiella sonneratiae]|uniref:Sulfurtransferase TusA family protein n=1 Tax=Jiella sonneratiae TaxID=2816856 RepID=A0ABS3J5D7_9HYPH|nr:sulfurtransferase TusA family protein [Jiella sonneratiae]MBO0904889.1 sulfurtransferase TusA family protein [Jiella sonneratiae]
MKSVATIEAERWVELDLTGLRCPLPVLRTRKHLAGLPDGMGLAVVADDPLATLDITHLCREEGHLLAATRLEGTATRFEIVKRRRAVE